MAKTIIEFEGIYGGPQAREIILRILKEALALVENTDPGASLICSGFRIEQERSEERAGRNT
jgi:hypothetical protein